MGFVYLSPPPALTPTPCSTPSISTGPLPMLFPSSLLRSFLFQEPFQENWNRSVCPGQRRAGSGVASHQGLGPIKTQVAHPSQASEKAHSQILTLDGVGTCQVGGGDSPPPPPPANVPTRWVKGQPQTWVALLHLGGPAERRESRRPVQQPPEAGPAGSSVVDRCKMGRWVESAGLVRRPPQTSRAGL